MIEINKHNIIAIESFTKISSERTSPKEPQVWYKCKCSCGLSFEIRRFLFKDRKFCCYSCASRCSKGSANWRGIGNLRASYLTKVKAHALTRNIEVDITLEDMYNKLIEQKNKCALSGLELSLRMHHKDNSCNASLDRVDSDKHYTFDNIQWVHKQINSMKWDLSQYEFVQFCKLVIIPIIETEYNTILDFQNCHPGYKGCGALSSRFFSIAKNAAYSRDINFDITIQQTWEKFKQQAGRCYFTGQNLTFGKSYKTKNDTTASIDRLDNNRGYTIDNIVWVHKYINLMKLRLTEVDFRDWCRKIYNHSCLAI